MMFQRVEIVEAKTAGIFTEIVNSSGVPLERSWSIGNSLPSDIEPALEAGMAAVWLDAHVWEHERRAHQVQLDHRRLHVAASLYEVPKIIEAHVVQHR
jgi:FMN phosphatase YigB (HAD superfamily)